jgi:ABC-type uncharacterized transport system ATPase subunit
VRPLIEMIDIVKVYPDGVKALDGVTLRLYPGRIHAILGENGAGKTTLMRILYGEIRPTRGVILLDGRPVKFRGTVDAIRTGIAMIYQHPRLVPTLSVWENMILYFKSAGIPRREVDERLDRARRLTGFEVPLDERVENLPLGARQRAEILRSIAAGARVLILDEPTTNLTPQEFEGLARALNSIKREGLAVVYITHRLPEVRAVADTITVLRRGRVVASELDPSRVSDEELARLMVGDLPPRPSRRRHCPGQPVLIVENLSVRGRIEVHVERLEVRAGEIVGLAGVEGNGQEELVGAIVGYIPRAGGRVIVLGRENPTPREYYRAGAAYIPGDRSKALTLSFSVAENLAFLRYAHGGPTILSFARLSRLFEEVAREYSIVAESPWTPAGSLSGGNQQKLLVASQLHMKPRFLLAVNPTRGLDVATTRYVRWLIARLAEGGAGVLLVSSDLDEVLELSDRIAVISRGRITGILPASEATPEKVGLLMGGAS